MRAFRYYPSRKSTRSRSVPRSHFLLHLIHIGECNSPEQFRFPDTVSVPEICLPLRNIIHPPPQAEGLPLQHLNTIQTQFPLLKNLLPSVIIGEYYLPLPYPTLPLRFPLLFFVAFDSCRRMQFAPTVPHALALLPALIH